MTDYPRFEPAKGGPDNAYQRCHGADLVAFVLLATDWWLQATHAGAIKPSELKTGPLRRESRAGHVRLQARVAGARTLLATCMFLVLCLTATNLAAQERCAKAPVDVTASSPGERHVTCSAANDALQLLGRCKIFLQRPLHVEVANEVRHPLSGPILGFFDTKQERVLITQYGNIPSLVRDTPYSRLPQREFYRSLIVHEVTHGVMHQNLKRPATSHSAYEYPAYALQIESLPSSVRDQFLQSFDQQAIRTDSLFNDSVLFFDPFFFAARAYHHFKAAPDGCAHLVALLEGEVDFIAAMTP